MLYFLGYFAKCLLNPWWILIFIWWLSTIKPRNSWQFCGLKIVYYSGDFFYFDCLFSINGNFIKNLCPLFCRFPLFWHPLLGGFTVSLLWSLISSPFRPLWKHNAKVSKEKINWDIYCMNCKAGSLIENHIQWCALVLKFTHF